MEQQIAFTFAKRCLRPMPEINDDGALKLALAVCDVARSDAARGLREAREYQESEFFSLALYVARDRIASGQHFDPGLFFEWRNGQGRKPGSGGRRRTPRGMRRLFE